MGINTIASIVKRLSEESGLFGNFTNHSLRRTAISRLSNAGFSVEEIKKRSGHRTNEGVMAYDVTDQKRLVGECAALYGSCSKENMHDGASEINVNMMNAMPENPGSIFYGANLTNCSININLNASSSN